MHYILDLSLEVYKHSLKIRLISEFAQTSHHIFCLGLSLLFVMSFDYCRGRWDKKFPKMVNSPRITEWFGLEEILKTVWIQLSAIDRDTLHYYSRLSKAASNLALNTSTDGKFTFPLDKLCLCPPLKRCSSYSGINIILESVLHLLLWISISELVPSGK